MRSKRGNTIQIVILIVCVLGFLLCAGWLIYYYAGNYQAQEQVESMKESYVVEAEPVITPVPPTPVPTAEPTPMPTPSPTPTPEPERVVIDGKEYPGFAELDVPERVIDFPGLQSEENEHIYAWIFIPGTNIDYPILQHPEKADYYLTHDTKGNKVTAGSIFTQYYNNKDFNDNNTVIYGHNMKNGSMFKTLHYYEDELFFYENPYVYIYTETDTRVYQIFGAYEYSDVHLLLSYNMDNDTTFGKYLEDLQKVKSGSKNHFNWDLGVTGEDKILTLSTCIANKSSNRYLVQAKLIAVEEVTEEATEVTVE